MEEKLKRTITDYSTEARIAYSHSTPTEYLKQVTSASVLRMPDIQIVFLPSAILIWPSHLECYKSLRLKLNRIWRLPSYIKQNLSGEEWSVRFAIYKIVFDVIVGHKQTEPMVSISGPNATQISFLFAHWKHVTAEYIYFHGPICITQFYGFNLNVTL